MSWAGRAAAERVQPGDRIYVWRGRPNNGFIAELEVLTGYQPISPTRVVPGPDPESFAGTFNVRLIQELDTPATDKFVNYISVKFGIENIALIHGFRELSIAVAERIALAFDGPFLPVGRTFVAGPRPNPGTLLDPFARDPDLIDRGTAAHYDTVLALAAWVQGNGWRPLLPNLAGPNPDPNFDLAWMAGSALYVAEIKSTTSVNEDTQLRLGLVQVLHYRQQLVSRGDPAIPWLVPEHEPGDPIWSAVCSHVGVELRWPGAFEP